MRYLEDGSLVPRDRPDALVEDEEEAVAQALRFVGKGAGDTICVHGDGPHALRFARRIVAALLDAGVGVRHF